MRHVLWAALAAAGCNSYSYKTTELVPTTPCGQGPYDMHIVAEGKQGYEGVEVVACGPHQLAGHVEVIANGTKLERTTFGDKPDNGRCVAGNPTVVATQGAGATGNATAPGGGGGTATTASTFVERPYTGDESPFEDDICKRYGYPAQIILNDVNVTTDLLPPGTELHVRIWSDAPNDLDRAVFLVRHTISKETKAEARAEAAKDEREAREHPAKPERDDDSDAPPPDHGPPPTPLAEQRPPAPTAAATWIAGYWTWTGSGWGWVAGFYRDDRVAMPAPRIEQPGLPPSAIAVWIGGAWQLRAGSWVWVRGRWR